MDTVLYDGECIFCTRSVESLRRLDLFHTLQFVSLHEPSVRERFPNLTHDMLMEQMWVVSATGAEFGGADAIRYLSRRMPMLYPFAPILHIPGTMGLWRRLYRFVAARRYKIAGRICKDGSCSIHAHDTAKVHSAAK